MSTRRLPFAAVLLAFSAACHSTAATDIRPADVYLLQSIDGRPLPTTRSTDPTGTVLHEELILDSFGAATRNTTVLRAGSSTETTTSIAYAYTRVGNVVTLGDFICTGNVPCAYHLPEQGTIDGGFLTLSPVPGLSPIPGSVLVYRSSLLVD